MANGNSLVPLPVIGSGKALAALVAGGLVTAGVAILDQYLPHALPPEAVSSFEMISTALAVYYTPHGGA